MRDEDSLKELELLEVARWFGGTGPSSRGAPGDGNASKPAKHPAATASWETLRSLVAECSACGLCKQRKQAVVGVGAEAGPWLFVGEAPGADEDEQGEPFVGKAGKLLDNMLATIGCRRGDDSYIANVVKCRPPGNRNPTPEEAGACAAFLDRQIELVKPKLIVALGKVAALRLLGTEASMASLRGKLHRYRGIPVVATYHPAYLLRSPLEKSKAWEDLLFARKSMRAAAADDSLMIGT